MKQSALCLCERDRRGPACASTQSDRRLSCSLLDVALAYTRDKVALRMLFAA